MAAVSVKRSIVQHFWRYCTFVTKAAELFTVWLSYAERNQLTMTAWKKIVRELCDRNSNSNFIRCFKDIYAFPI